jgi:hypothetical protein
MDCKFLLTLIRLLLLGRTGDAAALTVDGSSAESNIGGTASCSQGALVLDPASVQGWANYRASLAPSAGESGGPVAITARQIGAFTLSASAVKPQPAWPPAKDSDSHSFPERSGTSP